MDSWTNGWVRSVVTFPFCNPPTLLQEQLPFEGQSQYVSDYGPKRAEPMEFAAMPPPAKPLPFEGQSSYAQEFVAKRAEAAELPYVAVQPVKLAFEGNTEYAREFSAKQAQPMPPAAAPLLKEPLPFEGRSTYRDEFVAKKGECAELPYVPAGRPALPFEGSSRYHDDFGPKQAERYEYPGVPVAAPKLPFEGQSSYSADFVAKQAPPLATMEVVSRKVWRCLALPSLPSPSPLWDGNGKNTGAMVPSVSWACHHAMWVGSGPMSQTGSKTQHLLPAVVGVAWHSLHYLPNTENVQVACPTIDEQTASSHRLHIGH